MHAQRDIVLQIPSVCPSNAGIVYRRMHLVIVTLYDGIAAASLVFFCEPQCFYKIPTGTPLARASITLTGVTGWETETD